MTQVQQHDINALECRVQAGNAFYADPIECDLINKRLCFGIIGDPETPTVIRTLIFTNVQNFREIWHEEQDPDLLQQILFLNQYPQGAGFRYTILLDQSEMDFYSETEPELIETR